MKPIIELQDVWKVYQMDEVKVEALRGLNLEVKQGEFLSVMGASGSGKSTSMNMIGCLDIPTKGRIYLDGVNIAHLPESSLARIRGKKIGFIFQTFNLIPSLSALENVSLPMIFQNIPSYYRTEKAKELLDKVGLSHRMHHRPPELSGGERQRVAIARALSNDPEILLADEPTGNLDSKTGREILNMIKEIHKKDKRTVVMVTHDINLAKHADRIVHLKDGRIIKEQKRHSL